MTDAFSRERAMNLWSGLTELWKFVAVGFCAPTVITQDEQLDQGFWRDFRVTLRP